MTTRSTFFYFFSIFLFICRTGWGAHFLPIQEEEEARARSPATPEIFSPPNYYLELRSECLSEPALRLCQERYNASNVKSLLLRVGSMPPGVFEKICKLFLSIKFLDLEGSLKASFPKDISSISYLTRLSKLFLGNNGILGGDLAVIGEMPMLKVLNLQYNPLGSGRELIALCQRCPLLKNLCVRGCNLSSITICRILELGQLEIFDASRNNLRNGLSEQKLKTEKNLSCLKTLILADNGIESLRGLEYILRNFTQLEILSFCANPIMVSELIWLEAFFVKNKWVGMCSIESDFLSPTLSFRRICSGAKL